ncbi:hypothetical protein K492DRAFT_175331 [Lichtheimia hyalospora FSU 10163]|nr:hypothetical protein K492DRAFT_175331 [Lichtheimia hyalospora FSU 10163]
MLAREQPPPKAVNIIRPSSPFLHHFKPPHHHLASHHDSSQSSSTASSSSPSTLSTLSSFSSAVNARPTVLGPANFLSLYAPQHKQPPGFAQRLLQRAKSHSNLSKLTVCTTNTMDDSESDHASDQDDDDDSIDGNDDDDDDDDAHLENHQSTSAIPSDEDDDHYSPAKVVARIKHGTIMNGKGEFVSKGEDEHSGWLDEARANRKIADLEIEKSSLLAVNTTLEATLKQQAARIAELEKRFEVNDAPLTPVSDKADDEASEEFAEKLLDEEVENDQVFQRIRQTMQGLIEQAEAALILKTKVSGRVLTDYQPPKENVNNDEGRVTTIRKLAARRSWSPPSTTMQQQQPTPIMNQRNQRPSRRVSDSHQLQQQRVRPASFHEQPQPRAVIQHTKASMARTLSRSSSPAVMVSSPSPPTSPRSFSPPATQQRPSRPPSRASSLRRSQQQEQPRWR